MTNCDFCKMDVGPVGYAKRQFFEAIGLQVCAPCLRTGIMFAVEEGRKNAKKP